MANITRKDLKEVFTETLEPFAKAIQDDIARVDTKVVTETMRLDNRLARVEFDVREMRTELKETRADVKWMKDHTSELFAKLDAFIAHLKQQDEQLVMLQSQVRRLEERVAKIESRSH